MTSATPWPPPPDLASVKELVANADIEGFIADGAPADEYDAEAEDIHRSIQYFATKELVPITLLPVLKRVWGMSFNLIGEELDRRTPALEALAAEIERFFGPSAQPQVRGAR